MPLCRFHGEDLIEDMGFLPEGHAMRDSVSPIKYFCIMADSQLVSAHGRLLSLRLSRVAIKGIAGLERAKVFVVFHASLPNPATMTVPRMISGMKGK